MIARYAIIMVHVAPVDVSHAAVVKFLYETDVEIANTLALELVSADFSAAMVEGLILGKFPFLFLPFEIERF